MSDNNPKPSASKPIRKADDQSPPPARPATPNTSDTTLVDGQAPAGGLLEAAHQARQRRRRRHPLLRLLGGLLFVLVGLPLLAAAALAITALVSRLPLGRHVPAGFDFYVSIPSASRFANDVIHLQALDSILTTPKTIKARSLIRSLRSAPFLRNSHFQRLADIRVDAAMYPDGSYVAVADLGLRSAATRLAGLFGRFVLGKLYQIENLTYVNDAELSYFLYEKDSLHIYLAARRNLLIIASSFEGFRAALAGNQADDREMARLLAQPGDRSLRFLADPQRFVEALSGDGSLVGRLSATLDFPDLVVVDLSLADDAIGLRFTAQPQTDDAGLSGLLAVRSRTPALLSRLPAAAEYFSLLSLGSPAKLWSALGPFLDPGVVQAKANADRAATLAFGKTVDELLFSWMGDELGVFGTDLGPAPVFFARVGDERARRVVFDDLFGSLLVGRDVSTVVNGVRIPRLVFPPFIAGFLALLDINLPEPFYVVEDGFIYASASAEVLGTCLEQVRSGQQLVKAPQWESVAGGVSAQSSAMVYYNLERSLPFFLRSAGGLADTLRHYGIGAFALSTRDGKLTVELSAVRVTASGDSSLPGYPLAAGGSIDGDLINGRSASGSPMSYWSSGSSVHGLDLSSGERFNLELDDRGYLVPALANGRIDSLWAVSVRGTVYRLDAKPAAGFPLVSGQAVSGPPATLGRSLLVPINEAAALMIVAPDGPVSYSASMYTRSRSAPAVGGGLIAVLPRSFDSWLYLMDGSGAFLPGWPVQLQGIASAGPAFVAGDGGSGQLVAAVSESGSLYLFGADGRVQPGFPLLLPGVFDCQPLWVPGHGALVLVNDSGVVWRIGRDGRILDSRQLPNFSGRDSRLSAFDQDGDGREELFIGNDGNALHGLDSNLANLPGFPLAGQGRPGFIDIDGNGSRELVIAGADDSINAYRTGK